MELRSCGQSDLSLSVLGLGCWAFGGGDYWGPQDQSDVDAVVHAAVDLGINYFDTAEVYNDGRSEQSLGQALKGVARDKVVIGTKVSPSNCYPDTLAEHCHASLQRLGTDYVDVYMVHWPIHPHSVRHFTDDEAVINDPPPVPGAFEALRKLQAQGKVRHIGVSNFGVARLEEARAVCPDIAVDQLPYSLLTRAVELQTLPYCRANGIGVIGYTTLLQGILAGKFPTLAAVPPWRRRTRHFSSEGSELARHGEPGAEPETARALADIGTLCKERGLTMTEAAIGWAVANDAITCALVGARNIGQLESNVRAVSGPLAPDAVQKLNAATQPVLDKLGPSFDYYESRANDRT